MLRHTILRLGSTISRRPVIQNVRNKETDIPETPEELMCCQSGCANCVWLEHAEKMVEFYSRKTTTNEDIKRALTEIEKLSDENLKSFLRMELKMKLT